MRLWTGWNSFSAPPKAAHKAGETSPVSAEQARFIREKMSVIRGRLHEGLRHFSVRLQKPEPKQMLVAELSTLWVILENARPERMKGYGVEFAPQDKAEWENLIQALIRETELIRRRGTQRKKKMSLAPGQRADAARRQPRQNQ